MKRHILCAVLVCAFALPAPAQQNPDYPGTRPQVALNAPSPLAFGAPVSHMGQAHANVRNNATSSDYFARETLLYRWSDARPIVVCIHPAPDLTGWRPENTSIIQGALNEWQQALENRIRFTYTDDPKQADVNISFWTKRPGAVPAGATGYQDVAFFGDYMSRNDVSISLLDEHQQPWSAEKLYAFTLHETGHMLGLQEHSNDPDDMMAPVAYLQHHLSARDVATIRHLYASKTQYTNPPENVLAASARIAPRPPAITRAPGLIWPSVLSLIPH
jgi:predicted Zn-dependent protease